MRSHLINNDCIKQLILVNNSDLIICRKEIRLIDQHVAVYKRHAMNDVV